MEEARTIIEFGMWLTGHDKETVKKLFNDFNPTAAEPTYGEWINVEDRLPITYLTGNWDGKCSDNVLAEDSNGELYIANLNNGFLDGHNFEYWYDSNDYQIKEKIIKWMPLLKP